MANSDPEPSVSYIAAYFIFSLLHGVKLPVLLSTSFPGDGKKRYPGDEVPSISVFRLALVLFCRLIEWTRAEINTDRFSVYFSEDSDNF